MVRQHGAALFPLWMIVVSAKQQHGTLVLWVNWLG